MWNALVREIRERRVATVAAAWNVIVSNSISTKKQNKIPCIVPKVNEDYASSVPND